MLRVGSRVCTGQMGRRAGSRAGIACCLLAWTTGALFAESVELRYKPADGAVYLVIEALERQTLIGDRDTVTDFRERRCRLQVRESATGYANQVTVLSQTLSRNGQVVASPVFAAMRNLELVQSLDRSGALVRIAGYERLPSALSSTLPDQLARTLAPMVNADSLRLRDEAEYRRVYGGLTGATFEIGKPVTMASLHPLPHAGQVPLHSVSVLERVNDGSGRFRLTSRCHSAPGELAQEFESISEEDLLANAPELQAFLPEDMASARVQGSIVTMVDPAAVLVGEQTWSFEYVLGLNESNGGSETYRIRETRSFSAQPVPAADARGQASSE